MEVSGEVADLVVKEGLEASEAAVKLAGSGVKNIAALLLAIARDDYKVSGKTSAKRLAKDPNPPVVTPLKQEDLKRFQSLAKDYGLLYFIPRKKGEQNTILNVVSTETYAPKLNAIYQAMGYPIPSQEKQEDTSAKKVTPRVPQGRSSPERGNGSKTQTRTSDKPSVKGRLAALEAATKGLNDTSSKQRVQQKDRTR